MWVYEGCDDQRAVADVLRLDKGHTEGRSGRCSTTPVGGRFSIVSLQGGTTVKAYMPIGQTEKDARG